MRKLNLALVLATSIFMSSSAFANVTECAGQSSSDKHAEALRDRAKKLAGNGEVKAAPGKKRVVKQRRAG